VKTHGKSACDGIIGTVKHLVAGMKFAKKLKYNFPKFSLIFVKLKSQP